jgi:hypothetical protein
VGGELIGPMLMLKPQIGRYESVAFLHNNIEQSILEKPKIEPRIEKLGINSCR